MVAVSNDIVERAREMAKEVVKAKEEVNMNRIAQKNTLKSNKRKQKKHSLLKN